MTFDPAFLSNLLLILTGFGGAFLAALWVALVVWTYRDIRNRARDRLVHILAPVLVAVLNLPGVLVYLILRPQRTLEEEYQRTLEEEALLQEIEDIGAKLLLALEGAREPRRLDGRRRILAGRGRAPPIRGRPRPSGRFERDLQLLEPRMEDLHILPDARDRVLQRHPVRALVADLENPIPGEHTGTISGSMD